MVVARSAATSMVTVRDPETTLAAPDPSNGSAGGVVTPSGETSVKLSLVKKVLTGVPRALAWARSSCGFSCITGLSAAVGDQRVGGRVSGMCVCMLNHGVIS